MGWGSKPTGWGEGKSYKLSKAEKKAVVKQALKNLGKSTLRGAGFVPKKLIVDPATGKFNDLAAVQQIKEWREPLKKGFCPNCGRKVRPSYACSVCRKVLSEDFAGMGEVKEFEKLVSKLHGQNPNGICYWTADDPEVKRGERRAGERRFFEEY